MTDPVIRAAGTVLWRPRPSGRGREYALIHRPAYDDWSLPKGKLAPGETAPAAAVRETAEETGLSCALGRHVHRVRRPAGAGMRAKTVDYWSARVTGGEFTVNDEVDRILWLPFDAAVEKVDYDADRAVLALARARRAGDHSVVLVRHAHAGHRGGFDGPDRARPLSRRGHDQAELLAGQLSAFGVDRVLAADPVRCVQTVDPLAARLGTTVDPVPELSEEAFAADPGAGVAALARIAGDRSTTPAVCSQGGVIPELVAGLRARAGLPPIDTATAKAACWVLTFQGGQVVATDLLAPPDRPVT